MTRFCSGLPVRTGRYAEAPGSNEVMLTLELGPMVVEEANASLDGREGDVRLTHLLQALPIAVAGDDPARRTRKCARVRGCAFNGARKTTTRKAVHTNQIPKQEAVNARTDVSTACSGGESVFAKRDSEERTQSGVYSGVS
ncbi:uncharacterized protein [Temnothorax nylanderi]|uniref:uncharacterized protein isoform X2 n=1 Tax=Temnothorax nylanderi TaxID=102681 RepID=UPI003A83E33E